jgi:hypothetical protein
MAALVASPDFRCITPQERAEIVNWPANFSLSVQSSADGSLFLIDPVTGAYQFTRCGLSGVTLSGQGKVTKRGCLLTLEDYSSGRRVLVKLDTCQNKGTATVQLFPGGTFSIIDKNLRDNSLNCPGNARGL